MYTNPIVEVQEWGIWMSLCTVEWGVKTVMKQVIFYRQVTTRRDHHAVGARLREIPFSAERVKAVMDDNPDLRGSLLGESLLRILFS